MTNLEAVNSWAAGVGLTPELVALVELARTLATRLDGGDFTAALADKYLATLGTIAARVDAEGLSAGLAEDVAKLLSRTA